MINIIFGSESIINVGNILSVMGIISGILIAILIFILETKSTYKIVGKRALIEKTQLKAIFLIFSVIFAAIIVEVIFQKEILILNLISCIVMFFLLIMMVKSFFIVSKFIINDEYQGKVIFEYIEDRIIQYKNKIETNCERKENGIVRSMPYFTEFDNYKKIYATKDGKIIKVKRENNQMKLLEDGIVDELKKDVLIYAKEGDMVNLNSVLAFIKNEKYSLERHKAVIKLFKIKGIDINLKNDIMQDIEKLIKETLIMHELSLYIKIRELIFEKYKCEELYSFIIDIVGHILYDRKNFFDKEEMSFWIYFFEENCLYFSKSLCNPNAFNSFNEFFVLLAEKIIDNKKMNTTEWLTKIVRVLENELYDVEKMQNELLCKAFYKQLIFIGIELLKSNCEMKLIEQFFESFFEHSSVREKQYVKEYKLLSLCGMLFWIKYFRVYNVEIENIILEKIKEVYLRDIDILNIYLNLRSDKKYSEFESVYRNIEVRDRLEKTYGSTGVFTPVADTIIDDVLKLAFINSWASYNEEDEIKKLANKDRIFISENFLERVSKEREKNESSELYEKITLLQNLVDACKKSKKEYIRDIKVTSEKIKQWGNDIYNHLVEETEKRELVDYFFKNNFREVKRRNKKEGKKKYKGYNYIVSKNDIEMEKDSLPILFKRFAEGMVVCEERMIFDTIFKNANMKEIEFSNLKVKDWKNKFILVETGYKQFLKSKIECSNSVIIESDLLEDSEIYLISKKDLGTLKKYIIHTEDFKELNAKNTYPEKDFVFNIEDLNVNDKLRNEMLSKPPEWLQEHQNQEEYLRECFRVIFYEKIEFECKNEIKIIKTKLN